MSFLRRLIVALESRVFTWRDVVAMSADGWLCRYGPCPTEPCGLSTLLPSLQYVADSPGSDEISQLVLRHLFRHLAQPLVRVEDRVEVVPSNDPEDCRSGVGS